MLSALANPLATAPCTGDTRHWTVDVPSCVMAYAMQAAAHAVDRVRPGEALRELADASSNIVGYRCSRIAQIEHGENLGEARVGIASRIRRPFGPDADRSGRRPEYHHEIGDGGGNTP